MLIVCSFKSWMYATLLTFTFTSHLLVASIDLTEEGGIKAAGSSMDFAFPPELSDALRRLYHLRRGPLLSPGPLQSMDDRAELRSLFVRLPLEDCLSMMAPALWSSGPLVDALARNEQPLLEDVPPETLSLWENVRLFAGVACFAILSNKPTCCLSSNSTAYHCGRPFSLTVYLVGQRYTGSEIR